MIYPATGSANNLANNLAHLQ